MKTSSDASSSSGCNCATHATRSTNRDFMSQLPPDDSEERELAERGFIGRLPTTVIRNAEGRVVWDMAQYQAFLAPGAPAPDTVNPSLWRHAKQNAIHGLFKVTDGLYQVRGYDLANISFVEGKTGWIVIDPCCSNEVATAAMALVLRHLPPRPVVAVIYSHSHFDHFGGVKGIVDAADVAAGRVQVIAPAGFTTAVVSENVYAGNAMGRRATYMFGNLLPAGPQGFVDGGLGKCLSTGEVGLIEPTREIHRTGERIEIDGVEIVFQMTPGTEAPAEMNFYFPALKALCMAENASAVLHNLYTPRGAQIRDALGWARYISEAIDLFGNDAEVMFISHHWPRWGSAKIIDYLKKQRDVYRYIHDQTLRLANHGHTMLEIAEQIELPQSLAKEWYLRGYYGTVNNNSKAVYQRYLGWFDANPANLHPLPPEAAGKKYVEFMGGSEALLEKARASFELGEYRWVAQVLNHLVFAEPGNQAARKLQADTLEQLGYQSESAVWRNFYLTGAQELRSGVKNTGAALVFKAQDYVNAMSLDMLFDYMALRLNGPKANGLNLAFELEFTDIGENYLLTVENSVLNHATGKSLPDVNARLYLTRSVFNDIQMHESTFQSRLDQGDIELVGSRNDFERFLSLLDDFEFWFNIVTP